MQINAILSGFKCSIQMMHAFISDAFINADDTFLLLKALYYL